MRLRARPLARRARQAAPGQVSRVRSRGVAVSQAHRSRPGDRSGLDRLVRDVADAGYADATAGDAVETLFDVLADAGPDAPISAHAIARAVLAGAGGDRGRRPQPRAASSPASSRTTLTA